MLFDPEAIDRLSPAARVEVQDFYVRKYLAARRNRQPERRAGHSGGRAGQAPGARPPAEADRRPWPRVWFRHDSSRLTGFASFQARPRPKIGGAPAGEAE